MTPNQEQAIRDAGYMDDKYHAIHNAIDALQFGLNGKTGVHADAVRSILKIAKHAMNEISFADLRQIAEDNP